MRKSFSRSCMLCTAGFAALALGSVPALAQDNPAEGDDDEVIVVTGSRIARPNLESNIPIMTISGEEFTEKGSASVGDMLNDLPQLRGTRSQQNPGAGVGIAGLNLLDLRGLGTVRTLVLVNGRRHVPADILDTASVVDINTIPNDLIERTDIVTGGNSAVYGSDAIAGVVNFVLRKKFDGLQLRATSGFSQPNYGANQYISGMYGTNFADGRGNVILHGEFFHQNRIYASEIPFLRQNDTFVTVDADSNGLTSASDGVADNQLLRDIRSSINHRFGIAFVPQTSALSDCGRGTLANNGAPNNLGTAFHCNYIFGEDGRMTPQTGTRVGTGPSGTYLGGNGQTGREGTLLSIIPKMNRYSGNLIANFEFSPALEAFVEAKYVHVTAVGNALGPTFINNSTASIGNDPRIDPRLDNPYLNAADRATLASAITKSGCGYQLQNTIANTTCRALTAAERDDVATGRYRFLFARTLSDMEDRDERFTRDTFRIVAGLRGEFNDDWKYELSVNYGQFKERVDMRGFVNRQRFLLSLDAGRDPVTNTIRCRSQFDPRDAIGLPAYTNSAATLAADIAACQPYNVFGSSDNSAAVNYFRLPITNRSSINQFDVSAFVTGDTSGFFNLPGGPIDFALGGEYRREKAFNDSDGAADNGISNSVFLGDVNPEPMKLTEGFAELILPILRDRPFFHDLTISGAGRISHYAGFNRAVGTVYTYNGGVEWAPVKDIRFRANYGRSIRAPNVSEAGFPNVNSFANGFIDPCNINASGNNPDRSTNCVAQLSAAQRGNLPTATNGYSLGIVSGSNPNLTAEKANSLTIGGVFMPSFLPGLSLSVDYYDIKVSNVIVTLTAQNIVNGCYDSPGFVSPLCATFQRNNGTTNGPFGERPGEILYYSLVAGPQNFASRVRRGIDIDASYETNITDSIRLKTQLNYVHTLKISNFQDPARPLFEDRILGELGDPADEFNWVVDVDYGKVDFRYQMRFIGSMLTTTYENLNPLNGQAPLNLDAFSITKYPSVMYHNIRVGLDIESGGRENGFRIYAGIDNVANRAPPLGVTGTGAGSAIYAVRGRYFYGGVRARF